MKRKSLVLLLAGVIGCSAWGWAQQKQGILLKDATIVDGDAFMQPRKGSLLIKDGMITGVFIGNDPLPKEVDSIVDCKGKYITPGLIDGHVHLATGDLTNRKKAMEGIEKVLANMLRHGITTVRDMAGDAVTLAAYKRASEWQQLPAPAIFYAAQFAGPSYFEMVKRPGDAKENALLGTTPWYCSITDTTNIELAIAAAKGAGVSGIKVYADLSAEQILAITKAAHAQGIQVWSHAAVFPSKPSAVAKAGVNSMSHSNDLIFEQLAGDTIEIGNAWEQVYKGLKADWVQQDKLLLQMKANGIFLDATVFHAENNKMSNAVLITARAHQLGVKIVTGTDWIYPEEQAPVPLLDEMKVLAKKCGMSNGEVLQSATLNNAHVTGLQDRGAIKKGLRADLLLLNGDPLKDLSFLFSPSLVMKAGKIYKY